MNNTSSLIQFMEKLTAILLEVRIRRSAGAASAWRVTVRDPLSRDYHVTQHQDLSKALEEQVQWWLDQ